jgi:hypothetical protein
MSRWHRFHTLKVIVWRCISIRSPPDQHGEGLGSSDALTSLQSLMLRCRYVSMSNCVRACGEVMSMLALRLVSVWRRWYIFFVSAELGGQKGADWIRNFANAISTARSAEPPTPCFGGILPADMRCRRRSQDCLAARCCTHINVVLSA